MSETIQDGHSGCVKLYTMSVIKHTSRSSETIESYEYTMPHLLNNNAFLYVDKSVFASFFRHIRRFVYRNVGRRDFAVIEDKGIFVKNK